MKDFILQPTIADSDVIVQFTEKFELTKATYITVPNHYTAIVIDNEKVSFRIEPCVKKCIFKEYGKEYLGHEMKIAFILNKAIAETQWGFGNIQVNNARLKEAYRVGTNGKYQIEIVDYSKLINSFSWEDNITMDLIREKMISVIKTVGIPIVSEKFANTEVSVFEINSHVSEMRDKLYSELKEESSFVNMGVKITKLTLNGIHVNDEDLEMIRNRING